MRKRLGTLVLLVLCMGIFVQMSALAEEVVTVEGNFAEKLAYLHGPDQWQNLLTGDLGMAYLYGEQVRFYLNPTFSYNAVFGEKGVLTLQLREGYMDLYLKDLDLRVGRQLVSWGSGYKLNPTDSVNPMDLTAADPTAADLGVGALKGEYYLGSDLTVSGVIVGEFVPAKLPESMRNLPAQVIRENLSQQLLMHVQNPAMVEMMMNNLRFETVKPEITGPADLEYACRVTKRDLYGYDVSLSFFHGYEDYPSLRSDMGAVVQALIAGQEATVEFSYRKNSSFGLDLIGEVQGVGIWSEAAFSVNEAKQQRIEAVVGADYTFGNNLYAVCQWYHRNPLNTSEEEMQNYLLVHAQMPVRQIHQLSTTLMYDVGEQAIMLNPEMKVSLYDNLDLKVGTVWINGLTTPSESLLQNFGSSQTYIGLGYGF